MEDSNVLQLCAAGSGAGIVARKVTDEQERMLCLPRVGGARFPLLEPTVYGVMGEICASYDGGYWDFYTLSNGGFYMAPASEQVFHLCCDNYFERDVSADTAGLIATAYAYSELSFDAHGAPFARAYERLTAYIRQRADAASIYAALD
ncbi:antirestriction protein [Rugamonas apoptosis]|uniref:Antirestriction protein n=1 Tax=Rugamonas apoptosis TaxID=2758570 RepID=A0A7W2IKA9_9BURK|nr:antirestriction protein [Rugamonas apoptosis]MBA5687212.1 antirestriction protein [Rugamonas apoptosis]